MRTFIEATLVLIVAIALTLAIMAVIFPRHALGGLDRAVESPTTIWPAVFIDSTHDRPGSSGDATDRKFAGQGKSDECPYLAALAAASKCPAAPERNSGLTCPYLQELQRQLGDVETKPTAVRGHHI
jgi:hypothetical protein